MVRVRWTHGHQKQMKEKISTHWIQHFIQSNTVVSRAQTGKLTLSARKEEFIHREVSFHLGNVTQEFNSGKLADNQVCNADETHFSFDRHNHRTLAIRGEEDLKYADVVIGEEGFTIILCIDGGSQASLGSPFVNFQNVNCSYPIRGLPGSVQGVCYRTGKKGWIDR